MFTAFHIRVWCHPPRRQEASSADAQWCHQTSGVYETLLKNDAFWHLIDTRYLSSSTICAIGAQGEQIISLSAHYKVFLDTPFTKPELILEQTRDRYCKPTTLSVRQARFEPHTDQRKTLVRKSAVDTSNLINVCTSLRALLLYLARHPSFAGHSGQRCMYDLLSRKYYWQNTDSNVWTTTSKCKSCLQKNLVPPKATITAPRSIWATWLHRKRRTCTAIRKWTYVASTRLSLWIGSSNSREPSTCSERHLRTLQTQLMLPRSSCLALLRIFWRLKDRSLWASFLRPFADT